MTGPLGHSSLGDAWVEVHARTDQFRGDLQKGLKDAEAPVGAESDKLGKTVGEHVGKSAEKEVTRQGPSIARSIGKGIERELVDVQPNFRWNLRGRDGRFISRAAAGITDEVENAFKAASAGGTTIFSKIGQGIADAIGAGFNVSGKSPLVYILIPLYAALAGLIVAAVQAANGVVAALLAIPAAISVVAIEVGVLFLAFKGLGEAIQGAFAATSAEELDKALENLTPHAQSFVRALLPAKGLFDELKRLAQENFFAAFGGGETVTNLLNAIKKPLEQGIPIVAASLGQFFKQLTDFFSSPLFSSFLSTLFPAVAQIILMLSGPFIHALLSLVVLITTTMPFLLELTGRFGKLLDAVAETLGSVDPTWLNEMLKTLDSTFHVLGEVIGLVAVLFTQINKAGGQELLEFIATAVSVLKNFFASSIGLEAIKGLITAGEVGIFTVVTLIAVLALLFAGVQKGLEELSKFVAWLGDSLPGIKQWFSDLFTWLLGLVGVTRDALSTAAASIGNYISTAFTNLTGAIRTSIGNAITFLEGLPGRAVDAIGNLGGLLLNAGKNLIQGLIDGIQNKIPSLRNVLGGITNLLPDWKGPEEKDKKILKPAGEAVMEGFGAGILTGARDIRSLLGDFTTGLGSLGMNSTNNTVAFGAGAVAVNFRGALPTTDQAQATGMAVGAGITNFLAARNTRLAVRTL